MSKSQMKLKFEIDNVHADNNSGYNRILQQIAQVQEDDNVSRTKVFGIQSSIKPLTWYVNGSERSKDMQIPNHQTM